MPSKKKTKAGTAAGAPLPSIPKELIDQFVKGPMTAEAVAMASAAFKKALIERVLGAELSHHLGYASGAKKPAEVSNQRNGASGKTLLTDDGPLRIEVPRDREGSFEPLLIPKHERRFTGFDDKDDLPVAVADTSTLHGPLHIVNCALNLGGSSESTGNTPSGNLFRIGYRHIAHRCGRGSGLASEIQSFIGRAAGHRRFAGLAFRAWPAERSHGVMRME